MNIKFNDKIRLNFAIVSFCFDNRSLYLILNTEITNKGQTNISCITNWKYSRNYPVVFVSYTFTLCMYILRVCFILMIFASAFVITVIKIFNALICFFMTVIHNTCALDI